MKLLPMLPKVYHFFPDRGITTSDDPKLRWGWCRLIDVMCLHSDVVRIPNYSYDPQGFLKRFDLLYSQEGDKTAKRLVILILTYDGRTGDVANFRFKMLTRSDDNLPYEDFETFYVPAGWAKMIISQEISVVEILGR